MSAPDVRDLDTAPPAAPEPPADAPAGAAPRGRQSAADVLVRLAHARYRFAVSPDGMPFAVSLEARRHLALPLRGGRFGLRQALAADYYAAEGKIAGQQALADVLLVLEGEAQAAPPEPVHIRVAEAAGSLWVDMGDAAGRVVEIAPGGWRVVEHAPVLFRRTELVAAMPEPVPGGDAAHLFAFLNVSPADRPLLLAVLVAAFLPEITHPIPTLTGEQGTGKSTAARMLVDLLDPSPVPLRKPPRDADSYITALAGSWVCVLDNLSSVSDWLSDSLCRAVTGDGDVRRTLYTDGGLSVFEFRRQVILTGIDFPGLHGDLAERLLTVQLERIAEADRIDDATLWRAWALALPSILGGLLDLAARVLEILPGVRLERMPRMADFARVLAAVDRLTGSHGFQRYSAQAAEIAADTLAASPFTERLASLSLEFTGTAAELLERVAPADPEWRAPREWPRNARAVTSILKRDAPALRKNGWTAEAAGEDRTHTRLWRLVSPGRDARGDGRLI